MGEPAFIHRLGSWVPNPLGSHGALRVSGESGDRSVLPVTQLVARQSGGGLRGETLTCLASAGGDTGDLLP